MTIFDTKEQYLAFRTAWAKAAQAKVLTVEHMVLYNLIRNKPIHRGFTPVTNTNKLLNGMAINGALCEACWRLNQYAVYASEEGENYRTRWVDEFLAPFEGTLTREQLANIEVPEVKRIEPTYGKGMKMAKAIIDGEFHPLEMEDLEGWLDVA